MILDKLVQEAAVGKQQNQDPNPDRDSLFQNVVLSSALVKRIEMLFGPTRKKIAKGMEKDF